jgi:hypothetical protein
MSPGLLVNNGSARQRYYNSHEYNNVDLVTAILRISNGKLISKGVCEYTAKRPHNTVHGCQSGNGEIGLPFCR